MHKVGVPCLVSELVRPEVRHQAYYIVRQDVRYRRATPSYVLDIVGHIGIILYRTSDVRCRRLTGIPMSFLVMALDLRAERWVVAGSGGGKAAVLRY